MPVVLASVRRGARSRDLVILGLSGVVVIAAAAVAALLQPPATPPGAGSTFSAGPNGAKAAHLALARLGYRVERSFDPLADLVVDSPAATVVIVASPSEEMSAADRRAARRFVERGGTLLTTGVGALLLPELAAVAMPGADNPFVPREVRRYDARPGQGVDAATTVQMAPEAVIRQQPLYKTHYAAADAVGVASARFGAGRAIWWTGSDPMLNRLAVADGHMELLLDAIGADRSRRVIWNEFYHGHGRSFWSYIAGTPVVALVAQMGAITLIALLTYGRRRGPVRPSIVEQRTSVLEFVDALGALYRKAGAASGAVEIGLGRARRVLAGLGGHSTVAPNEQIASAAGARLGLAADEIAATLDSGAAAAIDPSLRGPAALGIVQRLQALCAKVEERVRSKPSARF